MKRGNAKRKGTKRTTPQKLSESIILDLSKETVLLFHRFKALSEQIHGEGELTAARRGILLDLKNNGPQTVPQMARKRPVTRQHMQTIVNLVKKDALVLLTENPAHKKSHLVALTPKGETHLKRMLDREKKVTSKLKLDLTDQEINSACQTLATVREAIDALAKETGLQ